MLRRLPLFYAPAVAPVRAGIGVHGKGRGKLVRFIHDGDGSALGLAGPEGSAAIEALYEGFYDDRGLAHEPTQISFRSD